MKFLLPALVVLGASSIFNAQATEQNVTSFACLDAKSLEVNAECFTKQIEMNDSFIASQDEMLNSMSNSYNALATLTMDPKTLNIRVVAHKDANLAKLAKD